MKRKSLSLGTLLKIERGMWSESNCYESTPPPSQMRTRAYPDDMNNWDVKALLWKTINKKDRGKVFMIEHTFQRACKLQINISLLEI